MPCYVEPMRSGGHMFIRGDLGPHCAVCGRVGEFLCDYPVGDGKTCDRPVCEDHCREVAPELHYCDSHHAMWEEFRQAGGVKQELENVVPFREGRKL